MFITFIPTKVLLVLRSQKKKEKKITLNVHLYLNTVTLQGVVVLTYLLASQSGSLLIVGRLLSGNQNEGYVIYL